MTKPCGDSPVLPGRIRNAISMVATPHSGARSLSIDLRADETPATGGRRLFAPLPYRLWLRILTDLQPTKKAPTRGAFSVGEPGGIRTHDLLIRSQTLYPAELRAHMLFDSSDILAQAGGHVKCFFDMMPAHIVYYLKHLTMMDQE